MEIINVMEKIVDDKIKTYTEDYDGCKCEVCISDIKCLSLNALPPRYINTPHGELFMKVEHVALKQNSVDVDFAVLKAIDIVKEKPRCENGKKK